MFNITVQSVVHPYPSDQNVVSLFGQMEVIIPVHILISQGRCQVFVKHSFWKTFMKMKIYEC